MAEFLSAIPELVLYGCGSLVALAVLAAVALWRGAGNTESRIGSLIRALTPYCAREGLTIEALDELRYSCERLDGFPRELWNRIDRHIERYMGLGEVERWFLTERARELLPYEIVIARQFNASFFSAIPGILTAFGLTLTFVSILAGLSGVHYDKANTVDPVTGIDTLINGLSGKFLSSIIALCLSILFTFFERSRVRILRGTYESLLAAVTDAIPYLSQSRILIDISRSNGSQPSGGLQATLDDIGKRLSQLNGVLAKLSEASDKSLVPANDVLDRTGERLSTVLSNFEERSRDFQSAGDSLLASRDFLRSLMETNAAALERMADAGRQAQTYSTGLADQSKAFEGVSELQAHVTAQLLEAAVALRTSADQSERLLGEYRKTFEGYQSVIDGLDQSIAGILGAIQSGLREYNQSIENNFKEVVRIANPLVSEAANLLQSQIAELGDQLEQLGVVISAAVDRTNGRA
jgi:hypothetical protein